MKISQLIKSDIVSDNAIIEIWKKNEFLSGYNQRVADGYKNDVDVLSFAECEIDNFYYKSYPEIFDVNIK